jgi:predicted RNase H-like HicB family nuclease
MTEYLVILEHGTDSWSAYVPDLPGCVAGADTREEVLALIREAIEMHIEGMKADGEPVPPPTVTAESVSVAA